MFLFLFLPLSFLSPHLLSLGSQLSLQTTAGGLWLSHEQPKFLVSKTVIWLPQLSQVFSWLKRQASLTIGKWEPREECDKSSIDKWTFGITPSAFWTKHCHNHHKPTKCTSDINSWMLGNINWGCFLLPTIWAKTLYPWWTFVLTNLFI